MNKLKGLAEINNSMVNFDITNEQAIHDLEIRRDDLEIEFMRDYPMLYNLDKFLFYPIFVVSYVIFLIITGGIVPLIFPKQGGNKEWKN